MSDSLENIDALKAEWDSLQPLSPENERRLWQKLRLEWNYHSNHIEGNTLTYGETVLLLIHGQTHGNHLFREYEEMKAHDVGIAQLRELAADSSRIITAVDIRGLNQLILKGPFWKPVITPDGQSSRAQVIPGEYKTLPNSVLTATGELFEYAAPFEVPGRMQDLADWLKESLERGSEHPVRIAAKLHHDFVLIHPFDDGNGRIARMLVNYVLLRTGFPPIVVPTENKNDYLGALHLADAGDIQPLVEFLAIQVERSLRLGTRAGNGENIEEPGDIEKEVTLFVRDQQARKGLLGLPSEAVLQNLAKTSFFPLLGRLESKLEGLVPIFKSIQKIFQRGKTKGRSTITQKILLENLEALIPGDRAQITFALIGFKGDAPKPFDLTTSLNFDFPAKAYSISQDDEVLICKSYAEPLRTEEIERISSGILSNCLAEIKKKMASER